MADNYCFPAFGSILKIDESLPSINVHLPHQLITYTNQFLLSLPYPYPYPPHPTPLSSSSILVTWSLSSTRIYLTKKKLIKLSKPRKIGLINLSIISRPLPAEEERARR